MTIDDRLNKKRVDEVVMSPDGTLVLYGVHSLEWAENDYDTHHYLYRVDGGETHRFICDESGEHFRFHRTAATSRSCAPRRRRASGTVRSCKYLNRQFRMYRRYKPPTHLPCLQAEF